MKLLRFSRYFALSLILVSCTRGCGNQREQMTPEKVVESYLNTALNMKQVSERDTLVQFTTGRLKEAISSASEDTIATAYIHRHYEIESYGVIERRDRTPRETEITFRLKYKDLGSNVTTTKSGETSISTPSPNNQTTAPTVVTENTVALLKEKNIWYIRDVIGAKTAIDFPVSQDSEIRAKPGSVPSPDNESDDSQQ